MRRSIQAVCLLLAACGGPDEFASSTAPIIGGGIVTSNIGVVLTPNCSGVMVRPKWMLTAAHCIDTHHDRSFGTSGVTAFAQAAVTPTAMAIDGAGRIVTLAFASNQQEWLVVRFDPSGNFDPSFGVNGTYSVWNGAPSDIAVDAFNRIVVFGKQGTEWSVRRLWANGTLDTSFGVNGIKLIPFPGWSFVSGAGIGLDSSGRVFLAGSVQTTGRAPVKRMALVRLTANGGTDTSFGVGGAPVIHDLNATEIYARDLEIDPSGRVLVSGKWEDRGFVARFLPSGGADTSLNRRGYTRFSAVGTAISVTPEPNGGFVTVGGAPADGSVRVLRFRENGGPETTFGVNGIATPSFEGFRIEPRDVVVDANGAVVVVGHARPEFSNIFVVPFGFARAVLRLTPTGAQDPAYARDGAVLEGQSLSVEEIAIGPQGRYVLFGAGVGLLEVVRYHQQLLFSNDVGPYPITEGTSTVQTSQVFKHTGLDVALVRTTTPIGTVPANHEFALYRQPTSTLANRTLYCLGYGDSFQQQPGQSGGFGILRAAFLDVTSTSPTHYWTGQFGSTKAPGDSGSPCFALSQFFVPAVTGIGTRVRISSSGFFDSGEDVAATAFAAWFDSVIP